MFNKLQDLSVLESEVKNNINSVSEGKIIYGLVSPKGYSEIYSVKCVKHGACNCVGITKNGKLWRCLTCNEGCHEKRSWFRSLIKSCKV